MSRWVSIYPLLDFIDFESRAGVYAVYDHFRGLIYVGETSNVQNRIKQHGFVLARYSLTYYCSALGQVVDPTIKVSYSQRFGEEAMRERRLIRRLKPALNYRGLKKRPKIAA